AEVARRDPEPAVRGAATRALGAQGEAAVGPLRGRLSDPDSRVRLAAVGALLGVGGPRALGEVGGLLATPPSAAGVEAARRVVQQADDDEAARSLRDDAAAYLEGVLRFGSGALRAQVGVALVSLPQVRSLDAALAQVLEREPDPAVRFQLARALLRRAPGDPRAVAALREVAEGEGMAAVQAAARLAERGDPRAPKQLARALDDDPPMLRAAAARALACQARRPDTARAVLVDPDPVVRLRAAGAILRCSG
ncbi:MAG: HEAT repeat domain-containing protein, partial [Myxococcota bacterium]